MGTGYDGMGYNGRPGGRGALGAWVLGCWGLGTGTGREWGARTKVSLLPDLSRSEL